MAKAMADAGQIALKAPSKNPAVLDAGERSPVMRQLSTKSIAEGDACVAPWLSFSFCCSPSLDRTACGQGRRVLAGLQVARSTADVSRAKPMGRIRPSALSVGASLLYRLRTSSLRHSARSARVTLLVRVLAGVPRLRSHRRDHRLSVVYSVRDMTSFKPSSACSPTRAGVLVFGLFPASALHELRISSVAHGLVANIGAQRRRRDWTGLALTGSLIARTGWRTRRGCLEHAFATNALVMACGFLLVGLQLSGYFLS